MRKMSPTGIHEYVLARTHLFDKAFVDALDRDFPQLVRHFLWRTTAVVPPLVRQFLTTNGKCDMLPMQPNAAQRSHIA